MTDRIEEIEDILFDSESISGVEKLAESGDLDAMYVLGMAYYDAEFTERDAEQCLKWLEKAAGLGHIQSCHDLACFHFYGYGFPDGFVNHARSRELLNISVKGSYLPSLAFLASMLINGEGGQTDVVQAKSLLVKAQELGCDNAQGLLESLSNA